MGLSLWIRLLWETDFLCTDYNNWFSTKKVLNCGFKNLNNSIHCSSKNIKIVHYWCNVTMRLYWRFESLHLIIEANLYSSLCWEVPIKRFGMGKNKNKFHERLVWIRDLTDLPACAYCNVFFPVRSNKIVNIFWHLLGRNSYAHFY